MKRFLHAPLLLLLAAFSAGPVQAQQVNFGLSSAIGEREVLVSQPLNQASPGALYVFHRSLEGDTWNAHARLTASDGTVGNGFGQAFAINGSGLLVGAPSQGGGRGAAYLFERIAQAEKETATQDRDYYLDLMARCLATVREAGLREAAVPPKE